MHEFIDFVARHYVLSSVFVLLLILLVVHEATKQGIGSRLSAQALIGQMNAGEVVVFDIRDRSSFEQGHIIGSKCVSADKLKSENSPLSTIETTAGVIICDTGQKSGALVGALKSTFPELKLSLLAGGLAEWRRQNLPLKKGKK